MMPPAQERTTVVLLACRNLGRLGAWWPYLAGDTVHLLLDRMPAAAEPTGPAASVHVVRSTAEVRAVIEEQIGAIDLLIDLRPADPRRTVATWIGAAYSIRAGGALLVRPVEPIAARLQAALVAIVAQVTGSVEVEYDGTHLPPARHLDRTALDVALLVEDGALLRKRQNHYRFVSDEQVVTAVASRPGVELTVLDELPAGTLHSACEVTSHAASITIGGLAAEMPYPRLQLRHYTGRIDFYGQTLLTAGNAILPDSHRFYRMHPLNHPAAVTTGTRTEFATVADEDTGRQLLPGTYYLLDPQFVGHYGHILTEVVPRLWGWDAAKAAHPDLKTLTMVGDRELGEPVLERLLRAYGIAEQDIVLIDRPVQLESVITASAMWHNFAPQFAHPGLVPIWDRIADALLDPGAPAWPRLFLTRRPGTLRTCHNVAEVEALFRAQGFEVIDPAQYDLGVQAGLFRNAEVVAGFGGSAMMNMMYARDLRQVIVLNHERFSARNEHLYAALTARRADWFWSEPDVDSFHSSWRFDVDRNGAELAALLASL